MSSIGAAAIVALVLLAACVVLAVVVGVLRGLSVLACLVVASVRTFFASRRLSSTPTKPEVATVPTPAQMKRTGPGTRFACCSPQQDSARVSARPCRARRPRSSAFERMRAHASQRRGNDSWFRFDATEGLSAAVGKDSHLAGSREDFAEPRRVRAHRQLHRARTTDHHWRSSRRRRSADTLVRRDRSGCSATTS